MSGLLSIPRRKPTSNTSASTFTGASSYWSIPIFPSDRLEQAERLEQLRALENGFRIRVVETEYESLGVDTPADWQLVSELYERTFSDEALAGKTKT